MQRASIGLFVLASLGFSLGALAVENIGHKALNKRDSGIFEGTYEPSISTIKKNIQMLKEEGRTRVFTKSDCRPGLGGFYTPSTNTITLCLNNATSPGSLFRTLYHEGVHRAQHCRNFKLVWHTPEELQNAIDRLPQNHRNIIFDFYDDNFERLLEIEARLWQVYAASYFNTGLQEEYFFNLSRVCGGDWARGYVDYEHYDSCKGGRPTQDSRGNKCPR